MIPHLDYFLLLIFIYVPKHVVLSTGNLQSFLKVTDLVTSVTELFRMWDVSLHNKCNIFSSQRATSYGQFKIKLHAFLSIILDVGVLLD
jgi:hypothetical protein